MAPGAPAAVRLDVPGANLVLDLHGSPQAPRLVLFMAGNQFRALPELLAAFAQQPGGVAPAQVFYATLPPGRLLDAMAAGRLHCGNLVLELAPDRLWPDVFMAGPRELQRLQQDGHIAPPRHYASNRGIVLLVRAGNPAAIAGARCLARAEVRVAISSPQREGASFRSYETTLDAQAGAGFTAALLAKPGTRSPQQVHHREIAQLIADGEADAAPLFRHLADYLVEQMPGRFEVVPLPDEGNTIDELWSARMLDSSRAAAADAWCDFLLSHEAAPVFARHGLQPRSAAA